MAADGHVDVVGVGTAVVDYVGVVPHYPRTDSQLQLNSLARLGGGNVSTTLAALSRLGASTRFLGKLGDDELGRLALRSVHEMGVDVSDVVIEAGASAGFAFIIVDASSGQRTILWSNQDKPLLAAAEVQADKVLSARYLHLDEYEMEAAIAAAQFAHGTAVQVVLDAESGLPGVETLLPLTDVLIASHDFARDYAGAAATDYRSAARYMHERLPASIVVVTAGEQGSYCVANAGAFHQPAFSVQAVDTTGCGDVFRGAFTFGLLQGWALNCVAEFASATSALKCRALGGRAGIPARAEVHAFIAERGARSGHV